MLMKGKWRSSLKEVIWEDKKVSDAKDKEAEAKTKDKGKAKAEVGRNLRSKKGVTINSQPEFAPSNEDLLTMDFQTRSPAKSILKKSSGLHVSIVLSSPPIKSKAQLMTKEGRSQDLGSPEPIRCTSGSSDRSSVCLSDETFQDVLKQMEVLHSPEKRSETGDTPSVNNNLEIQDDDLLKKMEEIHGSPPDDQFTLACLPPRDREGSPGPSDNLYLSSVSSKEEKNNQLTSTPVNSPGLVGEIRNKSLSRPTSRKASFPRRATPYPNKSLGKDQTEYENSGLMGLRRKIDFTSANDEESDDDEPNLRLELATSSDLEGADVKADEVGDDDQDPEKDSDRDAASASSSGHEEVTQSSPRQEEKPGSLSPSQEYVAKFQVSEEGGCEAKVADLFSDLDDLPQSQADQQVSSLSQTESSVDMFEDPEDIYDRVADLFSSNDPSQQVQAGSDFESEPELESVLSSL